MLYLPKLFGIPAIFIIIAIVGTVAGESGGSWLSDVICGGLGLVGAPLSFVILFKSGMRDRERRESDLVAEYVATRPQFAEFYEAYNDERLNQVFTKGLVIAGAVAAVALGVGLALAQESRERQVHDDIRAIRDSIDRM